MKYSQAMQAVEDVITSAITKKIDASYNQDQRRNFHVTVSLSGQQNRQGLNR